MFVLLLILLFKAYINISDIFSYPVFIKEIIKNNFMGKECISIYIYLPTYMQSNSFEYQHKSKTAGNKRVK